MSRAVVFDLDGTLIDSAPDIHAAANLLMDRHGFARFTPAETRSFIGSGVPHFIDRCLRARDRAQDAALHAQLVEEFMADYETSVTLTEVYPGVPEALARLASDGVPMGLCTNKPQGPARAVLRHLRLSEHFPVIVGGDSLPVRKPDPAPLRAAIEAVEGHDVIFVGDSEIDAETAQRAGVPFALYTEGYRKTGVAAIAPAGAFSDFADLPGMVTRLLACGNQAGPEIGVPSGSDT
jgi:phosphoglycolate phosphatase